MDFKERSEVEIKEQKADDYLEVARSLALNNRIDEALYYYRECVRLIEELGFKSQLNRLIWEIEKVLTGDITKLNYLHYEAFQEYDPVQREIILEKLHDYESGKNWVEKREELLEKTLTEAKKYADAEKYSKAKIFYARAMKFLKDLGWTKELETVREEIKLLDEKIYINEQRKKIEQDLAIQKKLELEKYLEEEKQKFEQKQFEKSYKPPEPSAEEEKYKKKMQIAEMNKKKATDAEKAGNYQIALNRYEYLYNLYLELNYDPIQREFVKQKIQDLKERIQMRQI